MINRIGYSVSILIALGAVAGGCGDEVDLERFSCNPYAQTSEPVQLVSVMIVGRDSTGTIYVVDETGEDPGFSVFVSMGTALYRKEIVDIGTGSTENGGASYSFTIRDQGTEYTILTEIDSAQSSRMALAPGDYDGLIADLGENGELLTVLSPVAVAGMPLVNLPPSTQTEYLAVTDNGDSLVVARPVDDWDLWDLKLFYGEPEKMIEREILELVKSSASGSTMITFAIDSSKNAEVYFGWDSAHWSWGEAHMTIDNLPVGVTRLHPESEDMGRFTFYCAW